MAKPSFSRILIVNDDGFDAHGIKLLEEDRDEYFERQINKLWENSLNQKLAAELLRQKRGTIPVDC